MSGTATWRCGSPAATHALGRALGRLLTPGDFVALDGALGAGKTHFVKGIAAGLGVPPDEPIVSPTFVLVREYAGRLKLYHLDAYRLGGVAELLDLGLQEMRRAARAVVALEWAERVAPAIPTDACRVELIHVGARVRDVQIRWPDPTRLGRLGAETIENASRSEVPGSSSHS